jgi:hypothetical protein
VLWEGFYNLAESERLPSANSKASPAPCLRMSCERIQLSRGREIPAELLGSRPGEGSLGSLPSPFLAAPSVPR